MNEGQTTISTPAQPSTGNMQGAGGIERHLAQMVAFASLDSVDELLEGTGNLYVLPHSYLSPSGLATPHTLVCGPLPLKGSCFEHGAETAVKLELELMRDISRAWIVIINIQQVHS